MVNLILFVLATIGLTNILIYGEILNDLRDYVHDHAPDWMVTILECYQCCGFWSGIVTGYALLTHDLSGVLMTGFAGSFVSHFAALVTEFIESRSIVLDNRTLVEPDDGSTLEDDGCVHDGVLRAEEVRDWSLGVYYDHCQVINEKLVEEETQSEGTIVFKSLAHPTILGPLFGYIALNDTQLQHFQIVPEFPQVVQTNPLERSEYITGGLLGLFTNDGAVKSAVLRLDLAKPLPEGAEVFVSYEYKAV